MSAATRLLHSPDLDGDRILLMVQQVTVVTGRNRDNKVTSIFFDKGSTCTMVTRKLVASLQLDSDKRQLILRMWYWSC